MNELKEPEPGDTVEESYQKGFDAGRKARAYQDGYMAGYTKLAASSDNQDLAAEEMDVQRAADDSKAVPYDK